MTVETAKTMIHQLANQLTVIMGNLDLAMLDPEKSPDFLDKARLACRQALTELRRLAHLLSAIADEAHANAVKAAKDAENAAIAAGVAVEQASNIKDAADEMARKTEEVKKQLENPWIDPKLLRIPKPPKT